MQIKTIMVHLNNDLRVGRLISAAVHLALESDAHLTGLFVMPHVKPVASPFFPGISRAIIKSGMDSYRQMGDSAHRAFSEASRNLPFVAEWRLSEPRHGGYIDAVLDNARAADLIVCAQKQNDWDLGDLFDVPDWLALESGRPVMIVPNNGELQSVGQRVLVAWNNSRESARAVADALPLLMAAKEVRVLSVEERGKPHAECELPASEICASLARHGVNCVADHFKPASQREPGEDLLEQVAKNNCDLLVMGCYGRSRLREFILGGASRHVLSHATVPVLMSH